MLRQPDLSEPNPAATRSPRIGRHHHTLLGVRRAKKMEDYYSDNKICRTSKILISSGFTALSFYPTSYSIKPFKPPQSFLPPPSFHLVLSNYLKASHRRHHFNAKSFRPVGRSLLCYCNLKIISFFRYTPTFRGKQCKLQSSLTTLLIPNTL